MQGFHKLGDGSGTGTIDYFDQTGRHRASVLETAEATDIDGHPMGITWRQARQAGRLAFDAGSNQIHCR